MLSNKKLVFTANTTVGEKDIVKHIASIDVCTDDVSFAHQFLDKEACKEHRGIVRKAQAEFEDWAYDLQEKLK